MLKASGPLSLAVAQLMKIRVVGLILIDAIVIVGIPYTTLLLLLLFQRIIPDIEIRFCFIQSSITL